MKTLYLKGVIMTPKEIVEEVGANLGNCLAWGCKNLASIQTGYCYKHDYEVDSYAGNQEATPSEEGHKEQDPDFQI